MSKFSVCVRRTEGYYMDVESDDEMDGMYLRTSDGRSWLEAMGESWEPVYGGKEERLERMFQHHLRKKP